MELSWREIEMKSSKSLGPLNAEAMDSILLKLYPLKTGRSAPRSAGA
jgi:hypothetical protein